MSCGGPNSTSGEPRASTSPTASLQPEHGGDPASIYAEQQNLESLLDPTGASSESGSEDEIPEEIILNSSNESCAESSLKTPASSVTADSITNQSESGDSVHKSATIAKHSEVAGSTDQSATQSAAANPPSSSCSETFATSSESGGRPNATDSVANPATPVKISTEKEPEKMDTADGIRAAIPGEYYAIQNYRKNNRVVPNLSGGYPAANVQPGCFYPHDDTRMNICKIKFDMEVKQVSSTSYDPANMACFCCGQFLSKTGDKYSRQTFVLTDQNFPATLPSDYSGKKCLKITRIEGGRLGELTDKFIYITEGWKIPAGSVILIASLSHLSETGLAAYIADLCTAVSTLTHYFKGSVSIAPAPFILAADTKDQHLIRAISDLYAWINSCLGSSEAVSAAAFLVGREGLLYNGGGPAMQEIENRYRLPTGFTNSSNEIWSSSGKSDLPSSVKQFSQEIEMEIVGRLLADLNAQLGLDLHPKPYYDRLVVEEDLEPPDSTVYIVVGGSHALRTANALARQGKKSVAATISGWRPTAEMITAIINKLKKAREHCIDTSKAVCVLQMWDNSMYFVQDEEGGLSAARPGADGKHHVVGASVFAHKDTQQLILKKTLPILEAVSDMRKILLSPLPRYWEERCCEKSGHVTNMADEEYKVKLEAEVYAAKDTIRAHCFRSGIRNARVLGSWHIVKKTDDIWGRDPVHMEDAGYDALAKQVVHTAAELENKRGGDESVAVPPKRQRYQRERDFDNRRPPLDNKRGRHTVERSISTNSGGGSGFNRSSGSGSSYNRNTRGAGHSTGYGRQGSDYGRRRQYY